MATSGPHTRTRRLNPRGDTFLSFHSGPGGRYREIGRIDHNGKAVDVLGRSDVSYMVRPNGLFGASHSRSATPKR